MDTTSATPPELYDAFPPLMVDVSASQPKRRAETAYTAWERVQPKTPYAGNRKARRAAAAKAQRAK